MPWIALGMFNFLLKMVFKFIEIRDIEIRNPQRQVRASFCGGIGPGTYGAAENEWVGLGFFTTILNWAAYGARWADRADCWFFALVGRLLANDWTFFTCTVPGFFCIMVRYCRLLYYGTVLCLLYYGTVLLLLCHTIICTVQYRFEQYCRVMCRTELYCNVKFCCVWSDK